MALSKIKSTGIADSSVTSAKIENNTIVDADVSPSAAVASSKICGAVSSSDMGAVEQNIALLGFKMAVNDGLTVFNLVDGVVDEFHDESGTDEGEGSNDLYCSSNDNYINNSADVPISAGFGVTSITEPTTSTAGTNPAHGSGGHGAFTVQSGMTSVNLQVWGAAGAGNNGNPQVGGAGGYVEGALAVTATQSLRVLAGEGGENHPTSSKAFLNGGGGPPNGAGGGGLAGVFAMPSPQLSHPAPVPVVAPNVYVVAGSGGAAGGGSPSAATGGHGGSGGGLTGCHGTGITEQTNRYAAGGNAGFGGGGSQTVGGQGGADPLRTNGTQGAFLKGADNAGGDAMAGGGAGYYGGGGGADGSGSNSYAAGGGSSFYGHPQVTSGSTEEGGGGPGESGGATQPGYVADTGEGAGPNVDGEDGYVLITGTAPGSTTSTTIVSNAFTAASAPTTSRIVVFQENVDSITLNTDIIASISRDNGSNFTNVTLADSGYVTGSSGQRILTGVATISGQPSGTSMRWKLALANNQQKIHGVSLQWK